MATPRIAPKTAPFRSPARVDESFRVIPIDQTYSGCHWHFHPELQISHTVRGMGERAIGDNLHFIEPGEVILLGANLPHVWRYDLKSGPLEAMAVHFSEDFLGTEFLARPELRDVRLLLSRSCQGLQFVGQTRIQLAPMVQSLRNLSGMARLVQLLEILHLMAASREVLTLASAVLQPVAATLEKERLQRVCAFVDEHFQQPIDRDTAADLACLSPSAFSRFFKMHTGTTFQDYVSDVRVGHACRLLLTDQGSITEIAYKCGFEDLSTFNRSFRKRRQMSPHEYRTRMQQLSQIGQPSRPSD